MTKTEALEIAKANHAAHTKALIEHLFRGAPLNEAEFGYIHGWFKVGEFCFNDEEITGRPYDPLQGGWAYA